jgi:hypothetical protein
MRNFLSSLVSIVVLSACGMVTGVDKEYTFDLPSDAGSGVGADAGRDAGMMCTPPSSTPPTGSGGNPITPRCWTCLVDKCRCEVSTCANNSPCARLIGCAGGTKLKDFNNNCQQAVPASLRTCVADSCPVECFQGG